MFSPDWHWVAWISRTQIKIMDVSTSDFTLNLSPYSNAVFSPDGTILAGAEAGWIYAPPSLGKVVVFDVSSGDTLAVLQHSDHVNNFTFSPDSRIIAASTSESEDNIYLWDWKREKRLLSMTRSNKGRTDLRFSPDGRFLLLGVDDGFRLMGIVP